MKTATTRDVNRDFFFFSLKNFAPNPFLFQLTHLWKNGCVSVICVREDKSQVFLVFCVWFKKKQIQNVWMKEWMKQASFFLSGWHAQVHRFQPSRKVKARIETGASPVFILLRNQLPFTKVKINIRLELFLKKQKWMLKMSLHKLPLARTKPVLSSFLQVSISIEQIECATSQWLKI